MKTNLKEKVAIGTMPFIGMLIYLIFIHGTIILRKTLFESLITYPYYNLCLFIMICFDIFAIIPEKSWLSFSSERKDIPKKYFLIGLVSLLSIVLLIIALIITPAIYYQRQQLSGATIPTVGIVSEGTYAVSVFEKDKTTMISELNWGTFTDLYQTKHHEAWIYSSDAEIGTFFTINWTHNAPSYLLQEINLEYNNAWYTWQHDKNRPFSSTGWMHIDFTLTTIPPVVPGNFSYVIIICT